MPRRIASLVLTLAACTTTQHRVVTSGAAVFDHVHELSRTGEAEIEAQDQGQVLSHYPVRSDASVVAEGKPRVLRDLIAGCEPPSTTPCELVKLRDEPILLRESRERHVNWTPIGLTGIGLVTAGVVSWGICNGARCDGSPTFDKATQVAGVTSLVLVTGALVYVLVGCVIAHACTH